MSAQYTGGFSFALAQGEALVFPASAWLVDPPAAPGDVDYIFLTAAQKGQWFDLPHFEATGELRLDASHPDWPFVDGSEADLWLNSGAPLVLLGANDLRDNLGSLAHRSLTVDILPAVPISGTLPLFVACVAAVFLKRCN